MSARSTIVFAALVAICVLAPPSAVYGATVDGAVHFELSDAPSHGLVSFLQDTATDSDMQPMQPMDPMTTPGETPPSSLLDRSSSRLSRLARRRRPYRLTRAPHMFGDWYAASTAFNNTTLPGGGVINSTIPIAGGSRRAKVSENNSALTKDRVWIGYNHFHNAQRYTRFDGSTVVARDQDNVDRLTLGWEKTLCNGDWSVELRMPFAGRYTIDQPDLDLEGGSVGDLGIFIKHMFRETEGLAISGGVGINTPTGSSVRAYMPLTDTSYELRNTSLTIQPFLAVLGARDIWFFHGFAQIDVPTNGHEWRVNEAGNINNFTLQEQTLLQLDGGFGVWLHDGGGCLPRVTGVAALVEWHYTSTLNDADEVRAPGNNAILFANVNNRYDVSNLTTALHFEIDSGCDIRVGVVAPLDEYERFFDLEAAIQINKHY